VKAPRDLHGNGEKRDKGGAKARSVREQLALRL
jgi:hypothetical protein